MKEDIKPELLMPAGDFDKLRFALAFGADAVYLGVPQFSLRARENGFRKRSDAIEAIRYVHEQGKKVYVTANILPHNHKVDSFRKYVGDLLDECQPDAWIMSDPGLIMLMRQHFPDEVIHLSVQANTLNYATAQFWQSNGIKRIILSRELSIREMQTIHQACPELELEAFVHGSICIAYSGRCLISNYLSYRDANQGTCSNSCRWQYKTYQKIPEGIQEAQQAQQAHSSTSAYQPLNQDYYVEEQERPGEFMQLDEDENGTYMMNSRDLCGIEYLDPLRSAGVQSFKVEGRSKSVYYCATIARVYRWAIDRMMEGKPFDPSLMKEVWAASSRGLISGFLNGNPGHTAQNYEEARSKSINYRYIGIVRDYSETDHMIQIEPKNPIRNGMELELMTPSENIAFTVTNLQDRQRKEIQVVHGGMDRCWVECHKDPGPFSLIRQKIV